MVKTRAPLCGVFISLVLLFAGLTPTEGALLVFNTGEQREIRWGVGIRGGSAFLTQDIAEDTEGTLGPIVSGEALYLLTEAVSLGLNIEWETHKIKDIPSGLSFGDSSTLSFIPFVEVRSHGFMHNSPYVFLGMGVNINSFEESDILQAAQVELEPDNTFALKIGAGTDYFVTEALALNVEFGWKFNSGKIHATAPGVIGSDDNNVNVLTILFGIRSYWP